MGNTKRGVVGTGLVRGIIMLVPSSVYGMGAVLEMHKCPLGITWRKKYQRKGNTGQLITLHLCLSCLILLSNYVEGYRGRELGIKKRPISAKSVFCSRLTDQQEQAELHFRAYPIRPSQLDKQTSHSSTYTRQEHSCQPRRLRTSTRLS
jgi:hypothetical protein